MGTTRGVRSAAGELQVGGLSVEVALSRADVPTPAYLYDLDAIAREARAIEAAFAGARHLVAYAVKANSAAPVVRALGGAGTGADVVSGAELAVALGCGIPPSKIVFAGVAKRDDEIDRAIGAGEEGIFAFSVESVEEIDRIAARSKAAGRRGRISLRLNPSVAFESMGTHAHIATGHDQAKFGIPLADAERAAERVYASPDLVLVGVGAHVGSQFTSVAPYLEAVRKISDVAKRLRAGRFGGSLDVIDTGGGFGIDYGAGCPVAPPDFVRAAREVLEGAGLGSLLHLVEPGRSLVGAHGILVARVVQSKTATLAGETRRWVMIDAGMNDLLRPALYQARHRVVTVALPPGGAESSPARVVGPVCESSDDFGIHDLPEGVSGLVALLDAGAYGFTMASQYNGRALPAEVFVAGGEVASVSPGASADAWVRGRLGIG